MNKEFKRIEAMIAHFKEHGWATGVLGADKSDFFEAIGIPLEKIGITSFTGNDIQYYDTTCLLPNSGSFKKVLKFSREPFHGYTHRFIGKFFTDEKWPTNIQIYSNCDSIATITSFIEEKKTDRVKEFAVIHKASREQDEATDKLIDEWLKSDI